MEEKNFLILPFSLKPLGDVTNSRPSALVSFLLFFCVVQLKRLFQPLPRASKSSFKIQVGLFRSSSTWHLLFSLWCGFFEFFSASFNRATAAFCRHATLTASFCRAFCRLARVLVFVPVLCRPSCVPSNHVPDHVPDHVISSPTGTHHHHRRLCTPHLPASPHRFHFYSSRRRHHSFDSLDSLERRCLTRAFSRALHCAVPCAFPWVRGCGCSSKQSRGADREAEAEAEAGSVEPEARPEVSDAEPESASASALRSIESKTETEFRTEFKWCSLSLALLWTCICLCRIDARVSSSCLNL